MFTSLTTASVFLSYRRADTHYASDALRRDLEDLGHTVFFDVSHVRPAVSYRDVINAALDKCDVAVVVIGPQWLQVTDKHGRRRLDDPQDVHRLEIARALARFDVAVLPVLVDGAEMPDRDDLPEDIRALTERHAVTLLPSHWRYGVQEVHQTVEAAVRGRWSAWGEAVVVGALAAIPAGVITQLEGLKTEHATARPGRQPAPARDPARGRVGADRRRGPGMGDVAPRRRAVVDRGRPRRGPVGRGVRRCRQRRPRCRDLLGRPGRLARLPRGRRIRTPSRSWRSSPAWR